MTIGCSIHRPVNVISRNKPNCLRVLLLPSLNVKVLLAKKLNTNAVDVDAMLLGIVGSPSATKTNNITKSIAVFRPPMIAKRNLWACFFICSCIVVLLYKI